VKGGGGEVGGGVCVHANIGHSPQMRQRGRKWAGLLPGSGRCPAQAGRRGKGQVRGGDGEGPRGGTGARSRRGTVWRARHGGLCRPAVEQLRQDDRPIRRGDDGVEGEGGASEERGLASAPAPRGRTARGRSRAARHRGRMRAGVEAGPGARGQERGRPAREEGEEEESAPRRLGGVAPLGAGAGEGTVPTPAHGPHGPLGPSPGPNFAPSQLFTDGTSDGRVGRAPEAPGVCAVGQSGPMSRAVSGGRGEHET
jgi:hypothetical protein